MILQLRVRRDMSMECMPHPIVPALSLVSAPLLILYAYAGKDPKLYVVVSDSCIYQLASSIDPLLVPLSGGNSTRMHKNIWLINVQIPNGIGLVSALLQLVLHCHFTFEHLQSDMEAGLRECLL
jgi:hypothetical protein